METNKNNYFEVFNFEKVELPVFKEEKIRGKEYISYGVDNNYPSFLYKLYSECSDHQSIIDSMVGYTIGGGITTTNQSLNTFFKKVNEYDENIDDISKKLLLDSNIFGGFAFFVTPTKSGDLYSIEYIDFMKLRLSEDEKTVYYSEKGWENKYKVDVKDYPIFSEKTKKEKTIYYYSGSKSRGIYPVPNYNAALKSIMTLIEIDNFHLNNVANGFQPSTIINFNNGIPTVDQMNEIEKKVNNKFSGTNGSKLLINFAESKEKAAEVIKLDMDNFGDMFNTLFKTTQNTIFTAHKVTSPSLFGIKQENTGFSKTEFMEAFDIYNNTVILSQQNMFKNELYKFFKYYFTINKDEIVINPYVIKNNE